MIAEEIKRERTSQGISQRELAKRLAISHITIYRFENNISSPSVEMAEKIANELGFTLTLKSL